MPKANTIQNGSLSFNKAQDGEFFVFFFESPLGNLIKVLRRFFFSLCTTSEWNAIQSHFTFLKSLALERWKSFSSLMSNPEPNNGSSSPPRFFFGCPEQCQQTKLSSSRPKRGLLIFFSLLLRSPIPSDWLIFKQQSRWFSERSAAFTTETNKNSKQCWKDGRLVGGFCGVSTLKCLFGFYESSTSAIGFHYSARASWFEPRKTLYCFKIINARVISAQLACLFS